MNYIKFWSMQATAVNRLIWGMIAFVFVLDLILPQHFDVAFAYLIVHFLAFYFATKNDVLLLTVVSITLTILAIFIKPAEMPLQDALLDRLLPILGFCAAAFFCIQFIELRDQERVQEQRFEALFQYANSGMLLTNREGEIVLVNPALETLFGYEAGELKGKKVEALIPARFGEQHRTYRYNYQETAKPRSMGNSLDLRGLKKDGSEFPVEVSLSPYRVKSEFYVIAFVIDNTQRKEYENSILEQKTALAALSDALQQTNDALEDKVEARTAELKQAKTELEAALAKERELGEMKSRFVSIASHEFRTPLTTILSSASLTGQYAEKQNFEQVQRHAGRIEQTVKGLTTILNEFLSVGKLEEGKVTVNEEVADVTANIEEVRENLQPLFKPGQTFEHRHEGAANFTTDSTLMKYILTNLLSNAIKYSPENRPIRVESSVKDNTLHISVHDKGMGIPESEQKHLFERFFRANNATNSTQGTGLGLYIVRRYAELLGGTVGFSSVEGEGSVFYLEIS